MLATFIIGLREGLEAALIVGIIAAFLRNNGRSLVGMWLGVALALLLSIAVGVGLKLAEHALPQAEQEALETVIGIVAVFFVTGMIVWMNNHARDLKRQLETDAAQALKRSGTLALASMAFLAVLKEGFETSVFLLATFSAAQSATLAAAGAIIGLLIATAIGWGIYAGGVRFNLSRFFRYTAAFLILVAAGLVLASLRTAHEAGWIVAGQQATVNLAWLVAPGTVQSALVTGVLGIPPDPRLIEVIGWLAYLIPVALYVYWPRSRRPQPRTAARLNIALAAVAAAIALALVLVYPKPQVNVPTEAALVAGSTASSTNTIGSARLQPATTGEPAVLAVHFDGSDTTTVPLTANQREPDRHKGIDATAWTVKNTKPIADAPATLTIEEVVALAGGRIPVGLNPRQHPGPYSAAWSAHQSARVWRAQGVLLDAAGRSVTTVTLSDGGLMTPRTLAIRDGNHFGAARSWQVSPAYVDQVTSELDDVALAHTKRRLWAIRLPTVLAIAALLLLLQAARTWLRLRRTDEAEPTDSTTTDRRVDNTKIKGVPYAAQ